MKKLKTIFLLLLFFTSICGFSQIPLSGKLTAGVNSPLGDFSNLYKSGVSVEAGLFYSLPLIGIDFTLTAGYNGFKYKNDYFTGLVNTNLGIGVANFNYSWTATDIPVMVGAKYKLPAGNLKPYVTGEIGLHFVSFSDRFNGQKITGNNNNPTTLSFNNATESGNEIGLGTAIGVGIEIPIIPKINLDINAKYNYAGVTYSKSYNIFINNNSQFTTTELKNLNYFTIRGGIVIDF